MRFVMVGAAACAVAAAACDSAVEPVGDAWMRASVANDSVGYYGTGFYDLGERRPMAPPHFLLHSEDTRGSRTRSIQLHRAAASVPEPGTYDLGRGGAADFSAVYEVVEGGRTRAYRAAGGSISIEAAGAGRLSGSFGFDAVLSHTCSRHGAMMTCSPVATAGDTVRVQGTFDARHRTGMRGLP